MATLLTTVSGEILAFGNLKLLDLSFPETYCRRVRRIELYMQAEKRAFEETGEHTLYAVNITDRADRVLANALEAIDLGANALLVNYWQVGLDTLRSLAEDARITVPLLGHNSGSTSLYAGTHSGMSNTLASGKLSRLCGADMGIVLSGRGSFPGLPERVPEGLIITPSRVDYHALAAEDMVTASPGVKCWRVIGCRHRRLRYIA